MVIKITNIDDIKKISKPWGYEKWIADGSPDFNYALKDNFDYVIMLHGECDSDDIFR